MSIQITRNACLPKHSRTCGQGAGGRPPPSPRNHSSNRATQVNIFAAQPGMFLDPGALGLEGVLLRLYVCGSTVACICLLLAILSLLTPYMGVMCCAAVIYPAMHAFRHPPFCVSHVPLEYRRLLRGQSSRSSDAAGFVQFGSLFISTLSFSYVALCSNATPRYGSPQRSLALLLLTKFSFRTLWRTVRAAALNLFIF